MAGKPYLTDEGRFADNPPSGRTVDCERYRDFYQTLFLPAVVD